jgi:MOSC domain-containing protein YiiM
MSTPQVIGIYITPTPGARLNPVESARAVAGKGLEGDRYHDLAGTFSKTDGGGREVTMIEAEAFEHLAANASIEIEQCEGRRNLVTRGIALNDLVGHEFQVGEVRLRGVRLCHPCGHLEKLTKAGVKQGLDMRGGLRCDIVTGGIIRNGDAITTD